MACTWHTASHGSLSSTPKGWPVIGSCFMRKRKLRLRQVKPLVHECVAGKCRSWVCNSPCLTLQLPPGLYSPSPQAKAQGPPQWGSHHPGCFPSASTPIQQSSHMPGDPPQTPLGPPAKPSLLPCLPPGVASTGGDWPIQPDPFRRPAALQSFSHMQSGCYLRAPGLEESKKEKAAMEIHEDIRSQPGKFGQLSAVKGVSLRRSKPLVR